MQGWQSFAHGWALWAWAASWQLAALAVLIALAALATRRLSARFRYALWSLVLIKAFLWPGLAAPWSLGNWATWPLTDRAARLTVVVAPPLSQAPAGNEETASRLAPDDAAPFAATPMKPTTRVWPASIRTSIAPEASTPRVSFRFSRHEWLLFIWSGGMGLFLIFVLARYARVTALLRRAQPVDEGPLRVTLERLALRLGARRRPPELLLSDRFPSPFLLGLTRPRIVLPASLPDSLSPADLENVLLHELTHWRRRDHWLGWLQVAAQAIFWFHPFLWWANARLRHEREQACDETVLAATGRPAGDYAETLLRVLLASRGRGVAALGFLGIFEQDTKLQQRLGNIMNQERAIRRFGALHWALLILLAVATLPMAAQSSEPARNATTLKGESGSRSERPEAEPPRVISTTPANGDQNVDPALKEISVTFDRDMNPHEYAWVKYGPTYPPTSEAAPYWRDRRTCVLRVTLNPGHDYLLGVNDNQYRGFHSASGVAAEPLVLEFRTAGKLDPSQARPKIVSMVPSNGDQNVDPGLKELRVTFDMPMGEGCSWTGGGPAFPVIPEGQRPFWSADRKTAILPVALKPGHDYELGVNSQSYRTFQSATGVPVDPVVFEFRTAAAEAKGKVTPDRWIRVVIGDDKITLEGKEFSEPDMLDMLEEVPFRAQTVLEMATATSQVDKDRAQKIENELTQSASRLGFNYPSKIGVHPLGSYGVVNTPDAPKLIREISVNVAQGSDGGAPTVQDAVIAICKAAEIPYDAATSAKLADPELKKATAPVNVSSEMAEQALLNVLNPAGLRFDLGDKGLYLHKRQTVGWEWNRAFENDPAVLGPWHSVDFVESIDAFEAGKRQTQIELYLYEMTFGADGKVQAKMGQHGASLPWSKGSVWIPQMRAEGHYEIRSIGGQDYLFWEWISGDVIVRGEKPQYYVFARGKAPADYKPKSTKWSRPFVTDSAVLGPWHSVDFVKSIDAFKAGKRQSGGDLWMYEMTFNANGNVRERMGQGSVAWPWSKGYVWEDSDGIESHYEIRSIKGQDYLFWEWMSGDVTIRHQKPQYYVLARGKAPADYKPRSEKWDRAFVDDPAVIGQWKSVDFVKTMDGFKPGERRWKGDLFLKEITFKRHGGTDAGFRWSKGYIWHMGDRVEGRYEIRNLDGKDYLFVEWMSGDVTIRHQKPNYYVLEKTDGKTGD
jgi:beta-lactamase regulating signal transducer with metallopeptidase domain